MAKTADVFPRLFACTKIANGERCFDVKFCPFQTEGEDPIFAVVGAKDIVVCRLTGNDRSTYDVVRWWKDEEPDTSFNSVAWTRDPTSQRPWICVAGAAPKQIQVFDVVTGEHIRRLQGHGRGINDLAVSPLSPSILASAGEDFTIRLWNLEPKYAQQPCAAMFTGEGHRQPILAAQFHPNGRWMLSGGLDTAVCLWAVPSLEELRCPDSQDGHSPPEEVHRPHFLSTEVHANYVDSLVFYGDLILSRCAKQQTDTDKDNEILLWKIDGFNSDDPPPAEPPTPQSGVHTRSAFVHDKHSHGFQRLLTFSMPHTDRFYSRFSLLQGPGWRPILAMGNQMSKYYFWDLQKLEEGYDPAEPITKPNIGGRGKKGAKEKAENLNRFVREQNMLSMDASSTRSSSTRNPSSPSVSATPEPTPQRKFDIGDPFSPLEPHHTETMPKTKGSMFKSHKFGTSQIAWSPDGTWMVSVGDAGRMCIFHRDSTVVGSLTATESNGNGN